MALIPSQISESLFQKDSALGQLFTNVSDTVETVSSIYDQIRGEADGLPPAPVAASTPATAPAAPAKPPMSQQTMFVIGVVILVGLILILGKH